MAKGEPVDPPHDELENSEKAPTPFVGSNSPSTSSIGADGSKKNEHSHSVSSLFHRHNNKNDDPRDCTLSSMLAPAVHIAGAHNPFVIGGLREDGSRTRPSLRHKPSDDGDEERSETGDDAASIASSNTGRSGKRRSKRERIKSAFGRSLSPWRYHTESSRQRDKRTSPSSISRLSCRDSLDVEREKKDRPNDDRGSGTESDGEGIKGSITPRNNAFGRVDSEDSEDDELDKPTHRSARNDDSTREATLPSLPEQGVEQSADDDTKDGFASGEESDDYIDFDEETLDNTLYNAGCIDLHDAWLRNNNHHSHAGTPDEHKSDALAVQNGYYGPDDYDAAWEGAGPTGHNENDEALTAPNVVIGQFDTDLLSDSIDVSKEADRCKTILRNPVSFIRPQSLPSNGSNSAQSVSSSGKSGSVETTSKSPSSKAYQLTASRPVFERNRCTITLVHGDYDGFAKERHRSKRYIVASDGSEESSYAIEWTIGTVLRDGDEVLIVSVMETDTKLDATDAKHEDKTLRQEHQRIRQNMAVVLARRATAVLQRTRLAVRVSCQALHARNSRHMFIDMIDFFEPTMCIVGSRGLNSLKGVLLGSFSNYCVQKSPVPVMVARKRLKLPALPKGKTDVVSNVRARHMRLDEAIIEKDANVAEKPDEDQLKESRSGETDNAGAEESGESGGTTTEAEKVKEAAMSRDAADASLEAAPGLSEEQGAVAAESTKSPDGAASLRGRAKFSLASESDEVERGRSRSRTSERSEG